MIRKKDLVAEIETLKEHIKRLDIKIDIDHGIHKAVEGNLNADIKKNRTQIKSVSSRLNAVKPSIRASFTRLSGNDSVDRFSNTELASKIAEEL